jgi:pyruvate,water dikinase
MEPSLIELLPSCSGLVCDRGGRLNPTATTAREYGIPVVTSLWCVPDALRHGDILRIDGNNGTVTVLSRTWTAA